MSKNTMVFLVMLGTLALAGCKPASSAAVTGTVNKLDRRALTPDHIVKVQLADISKADAPVEVLDEQTINNPGQEPDL
jgi:uncharacterized lipoprotein YbaY